MELHNQNRVARHLFTQQRGKKKDRGKRTEDRKRMVGVKKWTFEKRWQDLPLHISFQQWKWSQPGTIPEGSLHLEESHHSLTKKEVNNYKIPDW
jgi:hypothetical protein